MKPFTRFAIILLAVSVTLLGSGCATQPAITSTTDLPTVVSVDTYHDPIIGVNRVLFSFNDVVYRYAFIPIANGYDWITPNAVQQRISHFFYNIKSPIYLVNNLAQGNIAKATSNFLRFSINSTLGILGLFDPAKAWWDIDKQETYFESTLATYGVGPGAYLVLPFLGPSDLRNGPSLVVDFALNPISYHPDTTERYAANSLDYINQQSKTGDKYLTLYEKSDDPYIFFRNLYLQGKLRDDQFAAD